MSLSVQANNVGNLAFRAKQVTSNEPTVVDKGSYYEKTYTSEASTGKKLLVGLASAFIPGLGHAINGNWGKGISFFLGSIAGALLAIPTVMLGDNSRIGEIVGGIGALSLVIAPRVWDIVIAVKSANSETKQIVPKEESRKVDVQA